MKEPKDISILCLSCGGQNDIIASGIPPFEQINCSHCGGALGRWDMLVAQTGLSGDAAHRIPVSLSAETADAGTMVLVKSAK